VKHTNINKKCNSCGVDLILNDNYKQYRYDQKDYTCISCYSDYKKKEHAEDMYVNGKRISRLHPLYKPGRYKTFEGAAFSSLSNYEKSTEGFVYLITNPAWKGWVKIGMAIDANDRCNQYQTSSPMRDYKLEYSKQFNHRRTAEAKAHELCANKSIENNNEWFKINIKDAINLIDSITEEQNEKETA
jgi:hypothetical protein